MHRIFFLGLGILLLADPVIADLWPTESALNLKICLAPGYQGQVRLAPDGAGGAFLVWSDGRSASGNGDVYASHVQVDGQCPTPGGLPIRATTLSEGSAQIVSDDSGGAIIAWISLDLVTNQHQVYAQRIDGGVHLLWGSGVLVGSAFTSLCLETCYGAQLVEDGSHGAILCWEDEGGSSKDIYAQRLDSSGNRLWGTNGLAVCSEAHHQQNPHMTSTENGGVIVAWTDSRNPTTNSDIYVQKIDPAGNPVWAADGIPLCNANGVQRHAEVVSDGLGGAIVSWEDLRTGAGNTYIQRIDATGNPLWGNNGILFSSMEYKTHRKMISDGSGGVVIAFDDYPHNEPDLFAQRLDANGARLWGSLGITICDAAGTQEQYEIVPDGIGGVLMAWRDSRPGEQTDDIYGQHLDLAGNARWGTNGVPIANASGVQWIPDVVHSAAGSAIFAWSDSRGSSDDLYAQQISADGVLGATVASVRGTVPHLSLAVVSPSTGMTSVSYGLSRPSIAMLSLYDVTGRLLRMVDLGTAPPGPRSYVWETGVPAGLYVVKLAAGIETVSRKLLVVR